MTDQAQIVAIELSGRDPEAFDRLFAKLTDTIEKSLEMMSGKDASPGVSSALQDVASIAKNFARAKLEKPSIENQHLIAQISSEYAAAEERLASARKLHAEADSVEIDNAMKRLNAAIQMANLLGKVKALSVEGGDHMVLDVTE